MKNKPLMKLGMFGVLTASTILSCYKSTIVEAANNGTSATHIGTYEGTTTFATSSSNGIDPGLFIEVIDKDGKSAQYESSDGIITIPNTKRGAYVTQAKLLGKTMYRDLDSGELLESWEEGRNLELVSSEEPVLKTSTETILDKVSITTRGAYGGYIKKTSETTGEFKLTTESQDVGISFAGVQNVVGRDKWVYVTVKFNQDMSNVNFGSLSRGWTLLEDNKTVVFKSLTYGGGNINSIVLTTGYGITLNQMYEFEVINIVPIESSWDFSDYTPFESNILTTNEDITLSGIGDTRDELNLITSEMSKSLGQYTLTGSTEENWGSNWGGNTGYSSYPLNNTTTLMPDIKKNSQVFIAGNFPTRYGWGGSDEGLANTDHHKLVITTKDETIGSATSNNTTKLKEWLSDNPLTVQYELAQETVKAIKLTTDGYFSPETTAQISIEGETVPLIASITVPTETLSFMIDPNQEADKQFIAPEFSVTNDTYAPLRLEIKSFTQLTNEMNDVLPSKYSDWNTLNKTQSSDIALGIVPKAGDGWKSLTEGVRYVADDSNYELGVIKPAETVDFSFSALHGRTILKPLNLRYELSFIFDFE